MTGAAGMQVRISLNWKKVDSGMRRNHEMRIDVESTNSGPLGFKPWKV